MEKIKVPCGHPQDIGIILHSPFRRQIANWNAAKMATLPVNGLRGRGGGCFGGMRSDGEKDGSDPILTRRHFAERLDGTGKM